MAQFTLAASSDTGALDGLRRALPKCMYLKLRFAMLHEKSSSGAGFVGCFADN